MNNIKKCVYDIKKWYEEGERKKKITTQQNLQWNEWKKKIAT